MGTRPPIRGVAVDVLVRPRAEARISVPEVLRNLVHSPPLVDQEGRARVAQVVWAEITHVGTPKRRNPRALAPVLSTQMSSFCIREDKRVRVGLAGREV